jgi:hypothetical protein
MASKLYGKVSYAMSFQIFFRLRKSVLIAMLINRIRDESNVDLPIFNVFETPTIDALALAVQDLQRAGKDCVGQTMNLKLKTNTLNSFLI